MPLLLSTSDGTLGQARPSDDVRSVILSDMSDDLDVLQAVHDRAAALAHGDATALRRRLHSEFRWTSHRGATVDRGTYIADNTGEELLWRRQDIVPPW